MCPLRFVRLSVGMVAVLCGAGAWAADFSDAAKEELKRLEGTWKVVSTDAGGDVNETPNDGTLVTVAEGKLAVGDGELKIDIVALDPTSSPRLIDMSVGDQTFEGIYELDGDTWRICLNTDTSGVRMRPSEMSTKDQGSFVLATLRRQSPN